MVDTHGCCQPDDFRKYRRCDSLVLLYQQGAKSLKGYTILAHFNEPRDLSSLSRGKLGVKRVEDTTKASLNRPEIRTIH